MWSGSRITLLVRKSITGDEPLPTSTSYSSSDTGWNGATRETVENGYLIQGSARVTRLKPGENESSILRRDLILLQFPVGHFVRPCAQDLLIESDQIHPQG